MKTKKFSGSSYLPQEELIERLKKDFPAVFSEGKIDTEKLKAEFGEQVDLSERYGLTWKGKSDVFRVIQEATTKTLKPLREESINFDTTDNIFIEGENLETLKVLQRAYYGKVKMIYIDPPYNTGNDFVYNDSFAQDRGEYEQEAGIRDEEGNIKQVEALRKNSKDGGHFHSNWLNMMYPRLYLARNLLRQDGVIFVSIDDNEVHNLRMIMNEIFGEENFVAQFAWRKTDNQANIGNIARVKEYIVCYGKTESIGMNKMNLTDRAIKEYRYSDNYGKFRRDILLHKTRGRYLFNVETPLGKILNGPWMISEEKLNILRKEDKIYWTKGGDEQPYGKIYLKDSDGQISNDFLGIEYGTNQEAGLDLEKLFDGVRFFDFPKPTSLIRHFITIGSNLNDIILDFFAGSGTTAHAVMAQNAEDGGNRKWICVQLPEETNKESEARKAGYKNIADIAKERIRRVAKKIADEQSGQLEPRKEPIDLGFKVLKLEPTNFKVWDAGVKDAKALEQQMLSTMDMISEDAKEEDLLIELMLKSGIEPMTPHELIGEDKSGCWRIGDGSLIICLAKIIDQKLFDLMLADKPQKLIFLDHALGEDDQLKTNLLLQAEKIGIDVLVI